jgi:hypothetical protein
MSIHQYIRKQRFATSIDAVYYQPESEDQQS